MCLAIRRISWNEFRELNVIMYTSHLSPIDRLDRRHTFATMGVRFLGFNACACRFVVCVFIVICYKNHLANWPMISRGAG